MVTWFQCLSFKPHCNWTHDTRAFSFQILILYKVEWLFTLINLDTSNLDFPKLFRTHIYIVHTAGLITLFSLTSTSWKQEYQLVFNVSSAFSSANATSTILSRSFLRICRLRSFTRFFSSSRKKRYPWSEMCRSPLWRYCLPSVTLSVSGNFHFSST